MPDRPAFGGGATSSILHPIVMIGMIVAMVLIFVLPRKYVIAPVLLSIFLIPLGQQVYAAGVHWLVARIIILAALARVAVIRIRSREALFSGGLNSVDRSFIYCVLCESVAVILLYREMPALINQFGFLIDFMGAYCVMRVFIRDEADTYRTIKWMALLTVILGVAMVREQITLQNIFGLLGGVQATAEIRGDKIRSRGVFQHPLTAGVFGATLLPLFLLLWKNGKSRLIATVGIIGCTEMMLCSSSSSPLLAYVAGPFAIAFWPLRRKLRAIRWGFLLCLVALHLCMKAPVWMLIARVDLTGSSSGYHRAQLIDAFINHFGNWWLIGTKDAENWGVDIWDVQNMYVSVGETGGLLAFILFITMISRACARIGNARVLVDREFKDSKKEWLLWFLGAALFANLVAFFGVNYFDQSKVSWFVLLAMISACTAPILSQKEQLFGALDNVGESTEPQQTPSLHFEKFESLLLPNSATYTQLAGKSS